MMEMIIINEKCNYENNNIKISLRPLVNLSTIETTCWCFYVIRYSKALQYKSMFIYIRRKRYTSITFDLSLSFFPFIHVSISLPFLNGICVFLNGFPSSIFSSLHLQFFWKWRDILTDISLLNHHVIIHVHWIRKIIPNMLIYVSSKFKQCVLPA